MVVGPASGASVAVTLASLLVGGFWTSRKQVPSELPTSPNASSAPSAFYDAFYDDNGSRVVEQSVEQIAVIKEMLEQPAEADAETFVGASGFESTTAMINKKSLELVDKAIDAFTGDVPKLVNFADPEATVASFSIEGIKQDLIYFFNNPDFRTNFVKALSSDGSWLVWAIMASLPLDLLLIFCTCGFCCRKTHGEDDVDNPANENNGAVASEYHASTDMEVKDAESDTIITTPDGYGDVILCSSADSNVMTTQSEEIEDEMDEKTKEQKEEVVQEATSPNFGEEVASNIVQRSRRKSQDELRALMERKRQECQVVENTAFTSNTDAKSAEQSKKGCELESQSHGQTRAKCRNSSDLKALMEKKRDQCQEVESRQEHVETDAKASEQSGFTRNLSQGGEPECQNHVQTRAKCRNSSDLKALMEKKRDQCQSVESTQEHIETDAKAS